MVAKTKPKPRPRPKPKIGKGFVSSIAKNAVNQVARPYLPYNSDFFY
jgi:hypothetical protein